MKHTQDCRCITCKNNNPFDIPDHLINEILAENVVIFSGAGVSTENKDLLPFTLYEDVFSELGYDQCDKPFPVLMSEYCLKPNGRIKLLEKIRYRFQMIKSFRELYENATRFHRELSTIPFINTIVTTNWDTYFEDETKAIPFVYSEDTSFWETPYRKVLKIHGSITNYGSMVITEDDYKECTDKLHSNLIGSILKTLLSTKTILFIGYSFSDSDFVSIYNFIRKELKKFSRGSYIVTLSRENDDKFREIGLTSICTDANYFVACIKEKLVEKENMMSDKHLYAGEAFYDLLVKIHSLVSDKYDYFKYPSVIYTTSYQDGLIHALERSFEMKKSGYYHNKMNLFSHLEFYKGLRRQKLKEKNYYDVAYIDGYMSIHMMYLLIDELEKDDDPFPSAFYIFGAKEQPENPKEFEKMLKVSKKIHNAAYIKAQKQIKRLTSSSEKSDLVLHHPAYL
jgi:hypothetical protein